MTDVPASNAPQTFVFEVRGPEPRGLLAERLLKKSSRAPAPGGTSPVLLIDGQSAGPEVVREVVGPGLDRPLLLLHAGPEMRAALKLPISFVNESDAYLVLPGMHGEPPRIVDFARPEAAPTNVKPGEVPAPEPEPPYDVPDRCVDSDVETNAIADAVIEEIAAFQRGEPAPGLRVQFDPPPKGVPFYRYPSISRSICVSQSDAFYHTKYEKEQAGQASVTYYFTGYANFDSYDDFQSYILVVEIAVGTQPAHTGDLVTRAEAKDGFKQDRYLGWFQESIIVGLNYPLDSLVLLGTTPNTINRTIKESTTKGFSIDIGFALSAGGAKPQLGLNYKHEVSTTTTFKDWAVGEQTGLVKSEDNQNLPFVETVRWQYAVTHPYNGAVQNDLLIQFPETDKFTPQTTSGFNFTAATALEAPADSAPSRARKATFDAVFGWTFKYYYRGLSGFYSPQEFRNFFQLGPPNTRMELDLGVIPTPKAGGQNE